MTADAKSRETGTRDHAGQGCAGNLSDVGRIYCGIGTIDGCSPGPLLNMPNIRLFSQKKCPGSPFMSRYDPRKFARLLGAPLHVAKRWFEIAEIWHFATVGVNRLHPRRIVSHGYKAEV